MKKRPSKTTVKTPETKVKLKVTKSGLVEVPIDEKVTKSDKKYVKILATETSEKFRELGERVARKEIKWAYYTTENFIGVHYYLIINK